MKKIVKATIIISLFHCSKAVSQTINLPLDSVKILLCKKWQMDYFLLGSSRAEILPGTPESNYEFEKDGTFIETKSDNSRGDRGTWSYDSGKKLILLIGSRNDSSKITSLKEGELIFLADIVRSAVNNPPTVQIFYKSSSH
jgi:hypothetical protein